MMSVALIIALTAYGFAIRAAWRDLRYTEVIAGVSTAGSPDE